MSVQMVIELREKYTVQPILQAIEAYKAQLRFNTERSQSRLTQFEHR